MNGKRFLAVVMSLCMLSAEASHCAPFITQRIAAHADSAEIGSNSSGKVKSLTTRIGDVNGDGKVTEDDKTLLQKWLVQMVSDDELKLINADVNRDGNVDIMDLVDLSRLISHDPDYVYGSYGENTVDLESAELGADSEIFSEINTDDNAFKVSMDITASSDALASLSASESEYSDAIKSDMVVGVVPEFECEEGAVVDEVTLNFDIDPNVIGNNDSAYAAVSDDFNGVKRFNVFKYFDDIGMLLPIETKYTDTSITTTVDELGTYCIVDMEQWFETLGLEPEEFATVNTSVSPVGMLGVPLCASVLTGTKNTASAPIDVVFHDYAKDSSNQNQVEKAIMDTATKLFDEYGRDGNVRIYVSNYKGAFAVTDQKLKYAENEEELQTMLDKISFVPKSEYEDPWGYNFTNATPYKKHFATLMTNCTNDLRVYSEKYYVFIENMIADVNNYEGTIVDGLIMHDMIGVMLSKHSFIKTPEQTGGTYINKVTDFGDDVADFIISNHNKYNGKTKYKTFLPNGWKPLALDLSITNDYKKVIDAIKDYNDGKITLEERDKIVGNFNESDFADTDGDGLIDLKEIRYSFDGEDIIDWDSNGEAILPTIGDCMELKSGKEYVKNAFSQCPIWKFWKWSERDQIKNIRILPVKTDPTEKDSDFDDFTDKEDPDPMNYNTITIDDSLLDDCESINDKNPTITQDDLDKMIGHVEAKQTEGYNWRYIPECDVCLKNELVFTRTRKKDRTDGRFSLTPSRNSDFAFTITGTSETKPEEYTPDAFNSTVKVFYNKKGVFKKEEKQVQPVGWALSEDGTELTYVFALEKDVEYSIYVNNPTNNHEGNYELHVFEDNWVYAPEGAYTEIYFKGLDESIKELDEKDKVPSRQIYIPSQIIHNMFWKKLKWSFIDKDSLTDDTLFEVRCGQVATSTIFQSDYYNDTKYLNEFASEVGSKATVGGVVTATFTNGKFIGFNLFEKCAETVGTGSTVGGVLVTIVGGLSLILQTTTASDLKDFEERLSDALVNGKGNIVYNSTHTTAIVKEIPIRHNYQCWSAWNEKHYINKYTEVYFGSDEISSLDHGLYRQSIHQGLKYYLYMEDDPDNHFWDLYASGNHLNNESDNPS